MGKLDKATGGIKSPESAQRSPTQTAEERRYRAEENLRTCSAYHKLAADPNALRDVQKLATEQMMTLARVADHAAGATTRSSGSSPDKRTNTNPPKAASKGGSSEGGARSMGRASKTSSKGQP
jgi:hypothetical protein